MLVSRNGLTSIPQLDSPSISATEQLFQFRCLDHRSFHKNRVEYHTQDKVKEHMRLNWEIKSVYEGGWWWGVEVSRSQYRAWAPEQYFASKR